MTEEDIATLKKNIRPLPVQLTVSAKLLRFYDDFVISLFR